VPNPDVPENKKDVLANVLRNVLGSKRVNGQAVDIAVENKSSRVKNKLLVK